MCVENSNRSQMGEAFVRIFGSDAVEAHSAGSKPAGHVNEKAITVLKEFGSDLAAHRSKPLADINDHAPYDVVVTLQCGEYCPWVPAKQFIDWDISDPKHLELDEYKKVRDLLAARVRRLLKDLNVRISYPEN